MYKQHSSFTIALRAYATAITLPLSISHYRFSSKETTAASQHKQKKI